MFVRKICTAVIGQQCLGSTLRPTHYEGCRADSPAHLPALMAQLIALRTLRHLGERAPSCHKSCHGYEDPLVTSSGLHHAGLQEARRVHPRLSHARSVGLCAVSGAIRVPRRQRFIDRAIDRRSRRSAPRDTRSCGRTSRSVDASCAGHSLHLWVCLGRESSGEYMLVSSGCCRGCCRPEPCVMALFGRMRLGVPRQRCHERW
jgi:hypothetical protein